jgi:N-methylhydantoinase A
VLGRLLPDRFLGGRLSLDRDAASEVVERLGRSLGLGLEETALGIVAVATTHTVEAVRLVSAERGSDPRRATLVAFGGAGPLIAFEVAEALDIATILIPTEPGNLCALGMTLADFKRHYARTRLTSLPAPAGAFEPLFEELERRAHDDLEREGVAPDSRLLQRSVDLRYQGQSYEITLPWSPSLEQSFHAAHARIHGLSDESRAVEAVTLRLEATGRLDHPELPRPSESEDSDREPRPLEQRRVVLADGAAMVPVYGRADLKPGQRLSGPVLIPEQGSTTLVPAGFRLLVGAWLDLIAERTEDG